MSAATARVARPPRSTSSSRRNKAKILFVDDEQRVLNSMRALFRREYDVHLTTRGSEALQILRDNDIDVIVADQRMPEMTGVEVLGAGKEVSPRTVRILLTGYADLDAIEGSINIGEVFRFLSKPCPPNHLKETLKLAVEVAKSSADAAATAAKAAPKPRPVRPAAQAPKPAADAPKPVASQQEALAAAARIAAASGSEEIVLGSEPGNDEIEVVYDATVAEESPRLIAEEDDTIQEQITITGPAVDEDGGTEIVLSGDAAATLDSTGHYRALNSEISEVGVVVFSASKSFAESSSAMLSIEHPVRCATTLVEVTEILSQGGTGVLVTDFVSEGRVLRKMIATLKRYLPELITIVVSDDRDASEMISLINHGQVFRYMSKPAQRDRFMQNVNAAVLKHIQLRDNPELVARHQVEEDKTLGDVPQMFMQVLGRIKSMGRLFARS